MSRQLTVEIADWEGVKWRGAGRFFSALTSEGSLGVYPRHQPLLAILRPGEVKVEPVEGDQPVKVRVSGGFLSVDSDIVTVVADEAELVA
ncbi:MAG: F0F1 ATP synthase subunit epsilon [Bifidobacteriaceae bacterium]|jgi:F-type H+-transporting ATPase subunit epsilon|nr:F0F1 ATP synthase subunit epsilon [Bifidobacteriaceae bacterium]